MVVPDPVVLRADDRRDARRRDAAERLVAIPARRFEILQHPFVVAALLVDVCGHVVEDAGRDRVVVELARSVDRRLHQRHARADDAVHRAEVLGIDRSDVRAVPDPPRGRTERREDNRDLLPETLARAHVRPCPTRSSAVTRGSGRSSAAVRASIFQQSARPRDRESGDAA